MKYKFIIILLLVMIITGCGKDKINTDSKIVATKNEMLNNLSNYSYDVEITTKTGFVDVTVNMDCRNDLVNKIEYCHTDTIGVDTEEYINYNNKIVYTKVTSFYSNDENNGKWTNSKLKGNSNSWINLSNYIFNLSEEEYNGGIKYSGTIDSKKLTSLMANVDSNINISKVLSNDINIEVFINSSNYIEMMNYSMEIMGIEELVKIKFKDFNNSGSIIIPEEVK